MTADAEQLPFASESFDVVMSSIGVMFAPHHRAAADELVRVCRPGGTIALLSWTPEGMLGALFRTMKPFAAPLPPGAQSPPLWGSGQHLAELFGDRVMFGALRRELLEITAFRRARDYGEHFKAHYGPTIAVRANAARDGREREFDAALDAFCEEWNRGTDDRARFEQEYLLAVATREPSKDTPTSRRYSWDAERTRRYWPSQRRSSWPASAQVASRAHPPPKRD